MFEWFERSTFDKKSNHSNSRTPRTSYICSNHLISNHLKIYIMKHITFFILSLFLLPLFGQEGYRSAAVSMGKKSAQTAQVPHPSEIHITEYLNYHRHRLPIPAEGSKVHLDLQVSPMKLFIDKEKQKSFPVLQIGFSTPKTASESTDRSSNICLLVDRSGSMQGQNMAMTKNALLTFAKSLNSEDWISLVVFDHEATTILPSHQVGDGKSLISAIYNLQPRGSTNMEIGINAACSELMKHFSPDQTNRVIILTDAQINTGELSPQNILAKYSHPSDPKLSEHVDFTLVGVGINFNHDFARKFTSNSHNSIHFIHDQADIQKLFVQEAASLRQVAARQVKLKLYIDGQESETTVHQTFGLDNKKGNLHWELQDMNYGLTQVALIAFDMDKSRNAEGPKLITIELSYYDPTTGENVVEQKDIFISRSRHTPNHEVEKNWAIAQLALALKNMSLDVQRAPQQADHTANYLIKTALEEVNTHPYLAADKDVQFMIKILQAYQKDLLVAYGKG